ncbi:phosphatidylinositol binding [Basidiobolus ranarum]|uniref:Phosphatidylinositol binding n=1 Tax=Basidiobolus ranarum TaxID=34480 RepID=A0ABR2W4W9_9FUNG
MSTIEQDELCKESVTTRNSSEIRLSVLTLFGGFIFGYIYAVPSNQVLNSPMLSKFNIFYSQGSTEEVKEVKEVSEQPTQLSISPQIDNSLNRIFTYFIRDFIQYWFEPLNISKSSEFEITVRNSLNDIAVNFSAHARGDNVDRSLMMIYALSNTLIVHMREYRDFEASVLPLNSYLLENPNSPFNQLHDEQSQITHIQRMSKVILTRLLSKRDASSPCLIALFTEILTTSTIAPTLEAFSDPDWINQLIISIFKTEERHTLPSDTNEQQKEYERLKACGDQVLRVKVVEARQIYHSESYGLYCTITSGKTKRKTKFVKPESNPLWGENFNFSWPEASSKNPGDITLELYGRIMFPKDAVIGKACISREEITKNSFTRSWFPLQSATSKSEPCGEVLLEIDIIDVSELASIGAGQENGTMDEIDEKLIQENPLSLNDVLHGNKGFLEFMQFMEDIQAPPFLQFWMNAESFLQTSAQSSPELMQQDAEMIFKLHLSEDAKHRVPIDPNILEEIILELQGGHVTADCFLKAQAYAFDVMESPFFREFRYSDLFKKYCLDARFIEKNRDSSVDKKLNDDIDSVDVVIAESLKSKEPSSNLPAASSDEDSFVSTESNGPSQEEVAPSSVLGQETPLEHRAIKRCQSMASFPVSDKEKLQNIDIDSKTSSADMNQEASKRSRSMSDVTAIHRVRDHFEKQPSNNASIPEVEARVSSEETEKEDDGGGMKFLAAAITSLREQLVVTEDLIEQTSSKESSKMKTLTHNRDDLQRQVNQLVEMARDFADDEDKHAGVGLMDLKGIIAKVSDASRPTSIGPNLVQSLAPGKSLIFVIELERSKSSGGWMITRNFADFTNLHMVLREQFPKVDKIKFPSRQIFGSKANNQKLCMDLEKYLSMLLSDMLLCESKPLQSFLQPDSVVATHEDRDMGDGVMHAFKSAANLVKIPFVDTHKATLFRSRTEVNSPTSNRTLSDEISSPRNPSFESYLRTDESGLSKPTSTYPKSGKTSSKLGNPPRDSSSEGRLSTESSGRKSTQSLENPSPAETFPAGSNANIDCSSTSIRTSSDCAITEDEGSTLVPSRSSTQSYPPSSTNPQKYTPDMNQPPPCRSSSIQSMDSDKATLKDLSGDEVDFLIETFFALVEEMFDMTDRKQWLRRKALNVLKQILRQSYSKTINREFLDYLDKATSEESIVRAIDAVTDSIWPDGVWPQEPPKPRTDDEKQATKIEAKVLFVNNVPESILRMVGDYNAAQGVTRLFNMLQYQDLTKTLLIKILEAWVMLILSEEKKR